MNNQTKKFQLFGMEPFSKLTGEKAVAIANSIELISDNDILAQADRLEEYGAGIAKRNMLSHVNIEFNGEFPPEPFMGVVHILNYMRTQVTPVKRGFVRYQFRVTSGGSLLKYGVIEKYAFREVEIKENKLVYELDSEYATLEFTEQVKSNILRKVGAFKEEVVADCVVMNKAVDDFNGQLLNFVLPRLQQRLAKALKTQKNISDLNPFK